MIDGGVRRCFPTHDAEIKLAASTLARGHGFFVADRALACQFQSAVLHGQRQLLLIHRAGEFDAHPAVTGFALRELAHPAQSRFADREVGGEVRPVRLVSIDLADAPGPGAGGDLRGRRTGAHGEHQEYGQQVSKLHPKSFLSGVLGLMKR